MRVAWLVGALVTFIMGFILTITIIGAILGIPLIIVSIFILLLAFVMPERRRKIVKVYRYPRLKKVKEVKK
jgi:hypothetical protein